MSMVPLVFRQVLFYTEKQTEIVLGLAAVGVVLSAVAEVLNWISPDYPLHAIYLLLIAILPFLVFKAILFGLLVILEYSFDSFPKVEIDSPLRVEAARARILRIFVEKNLPITYLGVAAFFTLGFEKALLSSLTKRFKLSFPYVLFSKAPMVIIKFIPQKSGDKANCRIRISYEDELRARTLARALESIVKYP